MSSGHKVRFWDPGHHFELLESEMMAEIVSTLRAGDLVMREQMYDFERDFAALIGRSYCVGVSNCTDGLRLTLEALGVGPGAEVITVAHTFVATIAAIHHVGATPVLVDVSDDHLMDVERVEQEISDRTGAIIPVHLNGRTCDMRRLTEIASAHGLIILEDAAQAVGAKLDGQSTGTFGVAAAYSFYPAKLLGAFGDAGAIVTDDGDLAHRLLLLRDHGRATKNDLDGWGWNCRLDNLQASVLSVKLRHVRDWIERRRAIAGLYDEGLRGVAGVVTPPGPSAGRWYDVYQNYVVEAERRDDLHRHLDAHGVETLVSWPKPVHHQSGLKLDHFELPATERLCGRVISLPIYPELEDSQVSEVIAAVRSFYANV